MTEVRPLLQRGRLGLFLPRLLLVLVLLGPPTLREGREAGTAFESPLANLDWTYVLHLGVWGFVGLYGIWRFLQTPGLLGRLFALLQRSPSRWYLVFAFASLLSTVWSIFPLYTAFFSYKIWATLFLVLSLAREAEIRGLSPSKFLLESVGLAYGIGFGLLTMLFFLDPQLVTRPTPGIIGFRLTGGFLADYGAYALITFAFLGVRYLFRRRRTPVSDIGTLGTLLWALAALILAQTRSTLMSFVLVCLILVFFGTKGLRRAALVIGLITSGLVSASLAGDFILAYLLRGQDVEGLVTLSERTLIFSFLMDYWRESPVLGLGFQAGSRYVAAQFLEQTGLNMGSAHDVVSKVLVDLGLIGALLLFCAYISLWVSLVRFYKKWPAEQWILLVSLAVYGATASIFGGGLAEPMPIWVILFVVPSLIPLHVKASSRRDGS